MQNILVVDDDPAIIGMLRRGLSYEGFSVLTAMSGDEGFAMVNSSSVDLVVLDVMLPGLNGLEFLRRLREVDEQLPVLLLTAKDTSRDQVEGLNAGADDYVVKPFHFEVLLARIRTLLRRQQHTRPGILRYADLALDTGRHVVRRGEYEIELTSVEFKLLQEFLLHAEQVLSKETLLERVWEYDFGGNVVEVYVKQLRQKLEAHGGSRLIQTLRNVGYVLREG